MAIGVIAKVMPWHDSVTEDVRGKFFGKYVAFCRDRNDPMKTGRIRVYCPAIMGEDRGEESLLDWCLPCSGGLNVPKIDEPVFVEFEQGIITHGIYTPGWIIGEDPATSKAHVAGKGDDVDPTWNQAVTYSTGGSQTAELKSGSTGITATLPADTANVTRPSYPDNVVYEKGGHVIEVDQTGDNPRLRYLHPTGTQVLIDVDGSVHIRSAGAMWHESGGDVVFALKKGSTFKVIYPEGSGFSVGAAGFNMSGHACTILGRAVRHNADPI